MGKKRGSTYRRRKEYDRLTPDERVLVAIMNNPRDLKLAFTKGWYRIPIKSAPREMDFGWLAFYQTKLFKSEGLAINYWARVIGREVVKRRDLLPNEPHHQHADDYYYKLLIGELQTLPRPIISRRGRRIVFIPTTLRKFQNADDINDLFHESPLEDKFWNAFKERGVEAERQWHISIGNANYYLDFAIFCQNGQIDVECDGDTWHADPVQIPEDNARDNALTSYGWSVLRFNTYQIEHNMPECLSQVCKTADYHGGVVSEGGEPYQVETESEHRQLKLFDQEPARRLNR